MQITTHLFSFPNNQNILFAYVNPWETALPRTLLCVCLSTFLMCKFMDSPHSPELQKPKGDLKLSAWHDFSWAGIFQPRTAIASGCWIWQADCKKKKILLLLFLSQIKSLWVVVGFTFKRSFFGCLWKRTKEIHLKVMDSSEPCYKRQLDFWYFLHFKFILSIDNIINIGFNI